MSRLNFFHDVRFQKVTRLLEPCLRNVGRHVASSIFTLSREAISHRRPDLGVVGDFELSHFERVLDTQLSKDKTVLSAHDEVEPYNIDYTGQFQGSSKLVLLPKETTQLADAMKLCSNWNLGIVPQGGNSSLVGTSVPNFDEVIISTKRMNKIIDIDPDSGLVICEAGVIPSNLEKVLADPHYNLIPPVDLGSWEICNIGGNAATNARGMRTFRAPDFRSCIVGLEAVLPNGTMLNCLQGARKDLVGVDLKQCLIGTEGTFGMITKVAFICKKRPMSTELALLTCDDYESMIQMLRIAQEDLAETLTAFEYMNQAAIRAVQQELQINVPVELPEETGPCGSRNKQHAVLVEASSIIEGHATTLINAFVEKLRKLEICKCGVLSQNLEQNEKLWSIRKQIVDACKMMGPIFKFDLNIPNKQLPELIRLLESICKGERQSNRSRRVCSFVGADNPGIRDLIIFGQPASGSMHIIVTVDPEQWANESEMKNDYVPLCVSRIETVLCNWLGSGSCGGFLGFSQEFGGRQSRWIHRLDIDEYSPRSNAARDLQLAIKKAWDPNGIMNPYKTWPFISY